MSPGPIGWPISVGLPDKVNGLVANLSGDLHVRYSVAAAMISDLAGIQSSQPGMSSSMSGVQSGVSTLNNTMSAFQAQSHSDLAGVQTAIQNMQAATTVDPRPNIDAVKNAVNNLDADVNGGFSAVNGNLGTISSTLQAHGNTLASINGMKSDVDTRLDGANGWLGRIEADVNPLHNDVQQVHTDLVGLTNEIGQLPKMFDDYAGKKLAGMRFDSDSAQASGQAAAKPFNDSVSGAQSGLNNAAGNLAGTSGDLDDTFWTAQLPIIGSVVTFDFNPLHSEWLGPLVPAIYTSILWVVTYLYLFACYKVAEANLQHLQPYQARTAGTSVLGNNANMVSALGMAGLISLALAAVPAIFIAWFASPTGTYAFSTILTLPINSVMGASKPAQQGMLLLAHFIPVNVIITDALLYLGFRMGFGGVYFVARQIMLYLVGL